MYKRQPEPFGTLKLGSNLEGTLTLKGDRIRSWRNASSDLRFASSVTAVGMLLSSTSSSGELDVSRLSSLLEIVEKQDIDTISAERKAGLEILKRTVDLLNQ